MATSSRSTKRTKRAATTTNDQVRTREHEGAREQLFTPFRSLGHVTTGVPFVVQSRSSKFLETPALTVVTSFGNCWAMWEGQGLKLLFIGPDMGAPVTSLAVHHDSVFAASSNYVGQFVRGKEINRFVCSSSLSSQSSSSSSSASSSDDGESSDEEESDTDMEDEDDVSVSQTLHHLTLFGSTLIALTSDGTRMVVWDIPPYKNPASNDPATNGDKVHSPTDPSNEPHVDQLKATIPTVTPYTTIEFPPGFAASAIVHPASYLNKVVVGSHQGELAVWNVRTATLIHTFDSSSVAPSPSRITVLTQSPAIDVLGVGFASGQCVLFDVRLGEVLGKVRLEGDHCGEVTGVSFRNDDISQTLAVSSSTGNIALFDLASKMRLMHLVRAAHEGPVGGLDWLPGQPVMMTSGGDNSLKQWLLDSPTAAPRILKQRSGHHSPPHLVKFYGDDGRSLLTAGQDHALRFISVVRDSRGFELSQGSISKKANHLGVRPSSLKLPLITSFSYSTSRATDWDNVVTVSEGEQVGRTWSVENKRAGKWTLAAQGTVTTAVVSACGNYGLVGSTAGEIVMYNMQSGIKRKVFSVPSGDAGDVTGRHVTGIATDVLNRLVIASTLRGGLHFFDFATMKLRSSISVEAGITAIWLHRDNGLLAVCCDDLIVRIVDIETMRVVRELRGMKGRILDVAFSSDSRWLVVTSQDSVIRTFDLPTGHMIDAFRTATVATSLDFSPTSDFLATVHVDSVGVHLWANRAQFSDISFKTFDEDELVDVALPTIQGVDVSKGLIELNSPTKWTEVPPYTTPDQLSSELLTLSLMPRSRWQTLLNLETIKQRNKPKEAPKAPERAPFFLPTLPGVKQRFNLDALQPEEASDKPRNHKLTLEAASIETEFVVRLMKEDPEGDYQSFFEHLKSLSPSATDLEIRSLSTIKQLDAFLKALTGRLSSHKDFEAVQTYLAFFLRIHGDVLAQNVELKDSLVKVAEEQKRESRRLIDLASYAIVTLSFLRSTPVS